MALKDILVLADGSVQDASRLDLAADLAQRHEAHLTAAALLEPGPARLSEITITPMIGGPVLAELMVRYRHEAAQAAKKLEQLASEAARRSGVPFTWQVIDGNGPAGLASIARTADLAVLGQPNPDPVGPQAGWDVVEEVLISSGRPVLILPYAGRFTARFAHVLIGWNGSREGARAVAGAMPLLCGAERVTILGVVAASEVEPDYLPAGVDLAQHLGRHGIQAEVARSVAGSLASADAILDFAADCSADLLVVGAYGQSRLREAVVGGVSRSLLRHQTLPLLMAH